MAAKEKKWWRLIQVVVVGLLISFLWIAYFNEWTVVTLTESQLYIISGGLAFMYVAYLKLSTHGEKKNAIRDKERMHRLIDCIPFPVLVLNQDNHLLFFNHQGQSQLKLDLLEHTGKDASALFDCHQTNPFAKGFQGQTKGTCRITGAAVEITVNANHLGTGEADKLVLARVLPQTEPTSKDTTAPQSDFDAQGICSLVTSTEWEPHHRFLLALAALHQSRRPWQDQLTREGFDKQELTGKGDINKAWQTVQNHYAPVLKGLQMTIQANLPQQETVGLAQEHLEGMLSELLANALAQAQTGGTIALTIQIEDGELSLKMQDNGKGLQSSEASEVFDKGFVGSNQVSGLTGRGLGLTAIATLVEAKDGHAFLESAPGKGARVTLQIPV